MASSPSHHPGLKAIATAALIVNLLTALALIAYGAYLWGFNPASLAGPLAFAAGGIAAGSLGALLYAVASALIKASANSFRSYQALLDVSDLMRRQVDYARATAETSAMSDWAKRIVYREKDYEFLRDTIQGAFVRQDWDMAEHLIRELDEQFGYAEEAGGLRDELTRRRRSTIDEQIAAALERFDTLCTAQKWSQAARESERLRKLYPDDQRIAGLPQELELRRNQHKRQLLREYENAVRHGEVETAHQLLFELDHYLNPNEAAALKESARGVFKAKMQQMGVEFSIALSEKRFVDAIQVGEALVKEFPNSRFAQEIRNMLPRLRERVQGGAVART